MVDKGYALLFFIIILLFLQIKKTRYIKRWQNSLNLKKHELAFNQLYQNVNGFKLSRKAREKQDAIEYTYGEIDFLSFIALLSLAKPDHKTVFYDLGSGSGKAVVACAMVYPIHKSIGIEYLSELYESSREQRLQLLKISDYTERAKKITFIHRNFLDIDLHDATLIFINAATILGSTWKNLCVMLDKLLQKCTIITTSKPLDSINYTVLKDTKVQMSWGVVKAFIHVKKQIYTNSLEKIE